MTPFADPHLGMLSALAHAIASMGDGPALYSRIAQTAVTALGARAARVWLDDAESGALVAAGSFGVAEDVERELLDVVRLPRGIGMPGRIVLSGTPEFIEDAHVDPRWANARYIRELDLHAYAGLPLIADAAPVGVLSILFSTTRAFSPDDRARACMLADYAAITVQISQLADQRRRADALDAVVRLGRAAAHELNNPLTVVIGQLILLERDLGGHPRLLTRIQGARRAATRLSEIVRRMNEIVRVQGADATSGALPPMLDIRRSSREGAD